MLYSVKGVNIMTGLEFKIIEEATNTIFAKRRVQQRYGTENYVASVTEVVECSKYEILDHMTYTVLFKKADDKPQEKIETLIFCLSNKGTFYIKDYKTNRVFKTFKTDEPKAISFWNELKRKEVSQ